MAPIRTCSRIESIINRIVVLLAWVIVFTILDKNNQRGAVPVTVGSFSNLNPTSVALRKKLKNRIFELMTDLIIK
jgi:hypothetical protein